MMKFPFRNFQPALLWLRVIVLTVLIFAKVNGDGCGTMIRMACSSQSNEDVPDAAT
jgi:hypothetical protein